eukprot:244073-Karenia_brevis.AAC.1
MKGLGRLGYSLTAVPALRPFLGPLYAWTSSVPGGSCLQLPVVDKLILVFLIEIFKQALFVKDCARRISLRRKRLFKTDAMAEKGMVSIGGGLVTESGCAQDSGWFHLGVSEDTPP